ncbi:MAG: AAA family ATPase [Candidatus Moranbacteria bacterium]|nr:AAA family ATPase [Candidatus Moranbacteria bacterium]
MGKIILGISGEMSSGKDTVAHYLVNRYGAKMFMYSDPLRDVLNRLRLAQTRENLTRLSGALRTEFGDDLLSHIMANDAMTDPDPIIVIDGIRRQTDIDAVSAFPEFTLVYVEADLQTRYERLLKRHQNADDDAKTLEDFKKDHLLETEVGIPALKSQAGFVIDNHAGLEELYAQVDGIMVGLGKSDPEGK